jgi:hypothetical protein
MRKFFLHLLSLLPPLPPLLLTSAAARLAICIEPICHSVATPKEAASLFILHAQQRSLGTAMWRRGCLRLPL